MGKKRNRGLNYNYCGFNNAYLSCLGSRVMGRRGNIITTHHIVARHEWGTNHDDNLLRIPEKPHQALHILHQTRLIAEQLLHTIELSEKAMKPEVVRWLVDTITQEDPRDLSFRYKDTTHF